MSGNKSIEDVRDVLFRVIDGLESESKPMDLDRAAAICNACDQLVKTAKVEVDFLRVAGGTASRFIQTKDQVSPGIVGHRRHLLGG